MEILCYYSAGLKKIARQVRRAIKRANVVFLANHGLVTVGKDIQEAYQRSCFCEEEAKKILLTLRANKNSSFLLQMINFLKKGEADNVSNLFD